MTNYEEKKIWKWKGSFTVEAAFVIPLVLGIIFAWMFMLFYYHDRVVLGGMIQENLIKNVTQIEVQSASQLQENIQKKLWLMEIVSIKEKESMGKIKYKLRAMACWDIPVMKDFLGGNLELKRNWSVSKRQPEYLLRLRE